MLLLDVFVENDVQQVMITGIAWGEVPPWDA